MKPIQKRFIVWYFISDFIAAFLAWFFLFLFRKFVVEDLPYDFFLPFKDHKFYIGLLIVPEMWMVFHYFSGAYADIFRKSRTQELFRTLIVTFIGAIIIFFSLLLDDIISKYSDYYFTFIVLFLTQFIFTFLGRLFVLNQSKIVLRKKRFGFNTIIIGGEKKAAEIYHSLTDKNVVNNYRFIGWINTASDKTVNINVSHFLQEIGGVDDLDNIIQQQQVSEVIISLEKEQKPLLNKLLNQLAGKEIYIHIVPDMVDILSGGVKMSQVQGEAFIEISPELISDWERITKRWFDIIASFFALLLSSPVLLFVMLRIKMTSEGPIFYKQERLGQFGEPFDIIKFRSMYVNAESTGPKLTSDEDKRITPIGKKIRKYRIDEFPQFWNVIKGEMSIVGPRAERKFFADQIIEKAPHYKLIWKTKPGITSLGMVKYGYASTVDEMVQRLKYDMVYIENMNFIMDLKILLYTISTVLYGRGK